MACGFGMLSLGGQDLHWQLNGEPGQYTLEVRTSAPDPSFQADSLRLFVGLHSSWPGSHLPAMLGQASREVERLRFQPTFSFRPGVDYTAFLGRYSHYSFQIPLAGERPVLTAIYPSADQVPANLLKVYLHFSQPMAEGRAYEYLTLVNMLGDTVQQPFVPLEPELWSEDRRRLTLWLDPGRVKRGLLSHETHGVVIEAGQQYRLSIDADWKDVQAQPLGKVYEKTFAVGTEDYRQPQTDRWIIYPPRAGSTDPLLVDFGEPLDEALASRLLSIQRSEGKEVSGKVTLKNGERQWCFQPQTPWVEGDYRLVAGGGLEDLAGNNLNRPFDLDLAEKKASLVTEKEHWEIPFKIRTAGMDK